MNSRAGIRGMVKCAVRRNGRLLHTCTSRNMILNQGMEFFIYRAIGATTRGQKLYQVLIGDDGSPADPTQTGLLGTQCTDIGFATNTIKVFSAGTGGYGSRQGQVNSEIELFRKPEDLEIGNPVGPVYKLTAEARRFPQNVVLAYADLGAYAPAIDTTTFVVRELLLQSGAGGPWGIARSVVDDIALEGDATPANRMTLTVLWLLYFGNIPASYDGWEQELYV